MRQLLLLATISISDKRQAPHVTLPLLMPLPQRSRTFDILRSAKHQVKPRGKPQKSKTCPDPARTHLIPCSCPPLVMSTVRHAQFEVKFSKAKWIYKRWTSVKNTHKWIAWPERKQTDWLTGKVETCNEVPVGTGLAQLPSGLQFPVPKFHFSPAHLWETLKFQCNVEIEIKCQTAF